MGFKDIASKSAAIISAYLLGVTLFALSTAAMFHFKLANPETAKQILTSSGVYDKFVDSLIKEMQKNTEQAGTISVKDKGVQKVFHQTFNPEVIQNGTEQFIDGTYAWLHGEADKPSFTVDLTKPKNKLANGLGNLAGKRAAKLPPCTSFQVPDKIDYFNLKCLPIGITASDVDSQVAAQIKNDKNFLPDTKLTADDLSKEPGFYSNSNAPATFQLLNNLFWVLLLLSVALSFALVYFSRPKLKGAKKLSKIFVLVGFFVGITPFVFKYFIPKITSSGLAENNVVRDIAIPVAKSTVDELSAIYFVFGGFLMLIGLSILAYIYKPWKSLGRL